ncbi:MAG: lipopolysaccharide transport periplasmic protein LptA [Candidatus Protistobacter heckmanni]|nr:lipopolysaccharide transport periplasmic protein LptA [Candidatus Protistobacter heckmanni]
MNSPFFLPFPARRLAPLAALALGLALGLAAPAARAERADRDKPLALEADNARYDDLKQIYFLSGKSVLTKGTMVLRSHTAEVRIDPEGYEYAIAIALPGELAFIRQKTENPNEFVEGYGERIEYDAKTQIARLIGRARAKRLVGTTVADDIRGDVIINDLVNSSYQAVSNSQGGEQRVRAVLAPRKQGTTVITPAPAPAAKPAAPAAPSTPSTPSTPAAPQKSGGKD